MSLQALFDQAVKLHENGAFAQAQQLYQQIITAQPGAYQPHYLLALARFQQGHFAGADTALSAALKLNPDSVEALALRGVVLRALWRHDEALASFDRALELKPDHGEAWFTRGMLLLELRRFEDAIASFDRTLALNPNWLEAWNNRGVALHPLRRFEEEVKAYDQALALNPAYARSWHNRSGALQSLLRFEEAIASCDKAIAIVPDYVDAWTARAINLQCLERFDEALATVEKALSFHPDNVMAMFTKAEILCEMDRLEEGMAVYRKRAELVYPPKAADEPGPAHQQRHDEEQRVWLAARGVNPGNLYFMGGERLPGPAVNPRNAQDIAEQWARNKPQIVVIDNLLTSGALEALRRFCWGSKVWRRPYADGYMGAMPEAGFAAPLLAQIAEELKCTFPTLLDGHGLNMFWGFKYDSSLTGIRIHADKAAVNINFWITPDEANNDPEHGGLVVWDAAAPADWDVTQYNGDEKAARDFLAGLGAKPVTVPYRANRAVIFDSDLFHETDVIDFKPGYENRRINITMLYGRRTQSGK